MVDMPNITGRPSPHRSRSGSAGYRESRTVERIAAVTASRYHPQTLSEMRRLEEFLASGEPVRLDVPPGFYFNALV